MVNYLLISENYNKSECDEHTLPGEFFRLHLNDDVRYVIYQDKRCSCSCCCIPSRINDFEKSIKKIAAIVYEKLDL